MTAIGDIIRWGSSIPDDVTGVDDPSGDPWSIGPDGLWTCYATRYSDWADPEVAARYRNLTAEELSAQYVLKVTAVREQPAGLCEVGDDRVTCIVADEAHRQAYHDGRPVGDVATTLLASRTAADEEPAEPEPAGARDANGFLRLTSTATGANKLDPEPGAHWQPAKPGDTPGQLVPGEADEPRPVDLLDLVRQYGDECRAVGEALLDENMSGAEARVHIRTKEALYARIEGEVQRLRAAVPAFTRDRVIGPARAALDEAGIPGDQALWVGIRDLAAERDEARAEVERLKATAETFDEDTLIKVYDALARAGLADVQARDAVNEMQNLGLLFRERAAQPDPSVPQVLSLEQPPKSATLVGARSARRWTWPEALDLWVTDTDKRGLGDLLDLEGSVTVEMAPPTPTLAEDLERMRRLAYEAGATAENLAMRRIEAALDVGPERAL